MRFDMYNFRNHKLHYDCAKLAFGLYARLRKFAEESSFLKPRQTLSCRGLNKWA